MSKSFSRPLSHQEYLERKYLSQSDYDEPEKKKKKKAIADSGNVVKIKAPTVKIIDDDITLCDIRKKVRDEEDDLRFVTKEEKPAVANVNDKPKGRWKNIARTSDSDDNDERDDLDDIKKSSTSKQEKMSSGGRAGLISREELIAEAKKLKKQRNKIMKSLPVDVSGKNAKAVYRDKGTGKIRDLNKERAEDDAKVAEEAAKKVVYDRWNRGIVQVEQEKEKIASDLHEMSKPLARYKDDEDLDDYLKDQERVEDPMLLEVRAKKLKERKDKDPTFKTYPKYSGPPAPRNRFNIQPGYRWDGVDRSNGYEERYFKQISNRTERFEDYEWSEENL